MRKKAVVCYPIVTPGGLPNEEKGGRLLPLDQPYRGCDCTTVWTSRMQHDLGLHRKVIRTLLGIRADAS
jgi:hypothetical protein